MVSAVTSRRGVTLLECLVSIVVSGVLMAAVYALLFSGSRLARAESSALDVRRNVRAVAGVLRAELQSVSVEAGDLLAISDSAFTLRAQRGFGVLCAAPGSSSIVLDDSLLSLLRAIDATKDLALVYAEGDPRTSADDRWIHASVSWVAGGACTGGARGTRLTLAGAAIAADLAEVGVGAPVRLYEVLEYRRYRDAAGLWWLGVRGPAAGGGWTASSPIAGPLLARTGLVFRYADTLGTPTTQPGDVAIVEVAIHGVAPRAPAPGVVRHESLTVRMALRGP